MIGLVFGLRGNLVRWLVEATGKLMAETGRPVSILELNRGDALAARALQAATGLNLVLYAHRPDPLLVRNVLQSQVPYLVAEYEPVHAVEHLMVENGTDPLQAAREVLNDHVALGRIAAQEGALHISEAQARADLTGAIGAVAQHLRLELNAGQIRRVCEAVAHIRFDLDAGRAENPVASRLSTLPRPEAIAIKGAVSDLAPDYDARSTTRVILSRDFFQFDSTSPSTESKTLDVTGRPRVLIYGPFFCLPAGDWTAKSVFRFSGGLVGESLTADIVHFGNGRANELASTAFTITAEGVFEINTQFRHTDSEWPLEFRLRTTKHMFDGAVSFGYIVINRLAEMPSLDAEMQLVS